jgi:uncharacterized cupin superfamily protein
MAEDVNVLHPARWDADFPEIGVRAFRAGAAAGATKLGATLYELAPGGAVSPYHVHLANEELLVVLEGRPSIRTPAGVRALAPGDVVSFPTGPDGAHRVFNTSEEPARVLIASTAIYPEVAQHPDTGSWLTIDAQGQGTLFPPGAAGNLMEWMRRAMEAGAERDRQADSSA